jgi:hypothetical protein
MRVRQGWSGETSPNVWQKISVELEEEDLRRLVVDAGIDPAALPTEAAFQLLEIEAERLVIAKLVGRFGMTVADGAQRVAALGQQRTQLLDMLRRTS